jgi:hypothetical protein
VSALDMDAIALVRCLRHRYGDKHLCKCEECRAIIRVVTLAKEAVAMKDARRTAKKAKRGL